MDIAKGNRYGGIKRSAESEDTPSKSDGNGQFSFEKIEPAQFEKNLLSLVEDVAEPIDVTRNKTQKILVSLGTLLQKHGIEFISIKAFGSAISLLCLKDGDVDIYIEMKNQTNNEMKRIKDALFTTSEYRKIFFIPKARIPIIKCVYTPSNTQVDIGNTSTLGCENTRLICQYIRFNNNIRPLAIFLKYWLKKHEIYGIGKLNAYSLVWLIIFYMQQIKPALPSVKYLQQSAENKHIINDWDCSLPDNFSSVEYDASKFCIYNLLSGFFNFYSDFEYNKYVMCPYLGECVPIVQFEDENFVATEFPIYQRLLEDGKIKKFSTERSHCMFIQDPYEHHLNLTRQTSNNTHKLFVNNCKTATRCLETLTNEVISRILTPLDSPLADYGENLIVIKPKHYVFIMGKNKSYSDLYRCIFDELCCILKNVLYVDANVVEYDKNISVKKVKQMAAQRKIRYPLGVVDGFTNIDVISNRKHCKMAEDHTRFSFIELAEQRSAICARNATQLNSNIRITIQVSVVEPEHAVHLSVFAPVHFYRFLSNNLLRLLKTALLRRYPKKVKNQNSSTTSQDVSDQPNNGSFVTNMVNPNNGDPGDNHQVMDNDDEVICLS